MLGGAEGEPWWEMWVEAPTVAGSLETPAWAARGPERVSRREPRAAWEQGPPSPSQGRQRGGWDGHPRGRAAAAEPTNSCSRSTRVPARVPAGSHGGPLDAAGASREAGAAVETGPHRGGGHRAAMLGRGAFLEAPPEGRRGHSHTARPAMLRLRRRVWGPDPGLRGPAATPGLGPRGSPVERLLVDRTLHWLH